MVNYDFDYSRTAIENYQRFADAIKELEVEIKEYQYLLSKELHAKHWVLDELGKDLSAEDKAQILLEAGDAAEEIIASEVK